MYTPEELKEYAKVIMFNPTSNKSKQVIFSLAQYFQCHPNEVYDKIKQQENN